LLDVPIAKVRVKAVGVSVTLNSVTINNSFGTFSPSTALIESGIKQIKIFADNVSDNQFFDGAGIDPLVGNKVVQSGIGDTVSDVGIFLSTPVFIPTDSAKTFYIMYSFGNAMTVGTQASAAEVDRWPLVEGLGGQPTGRGWACPGCDYAPLCAEQFRAGDPASVAGAAYKRGGDRYLAELAPGGARAEFSPEGLRGSRGGLQSTAQDLRRVARGAEGYPD
jgi:hypothetical protein